MLKKVEMYTVVCDNCGEDIGVTQEYSCWNDENYVKTNALESEWVKKDGKHYCPKCYSYDEDDNLVLRAVENSQHKCETGCKVLSGGEVHHHKNCQFYKGSLSEELDNLREQVKKTSKPDVIESAQLGMGAVGRSVIRLPLGLMPKKIHDERVKVERFNEVCKAIARYSDAGLKINIEWIDEYNELVDNYLST